MYAAWAAADATGQNDPTPPAPADAPEGPSPRRTPRTSTSARPSNRRPRRHEHETDEASTTPQDDEHNALIEWCFNEWPWNGINDARAVES